MGNMQEASGAAAACREGAGCVPRHWDALSMGGGVLKVAGARGTGWGTSRKGGKAVGHGLTAGAHRRGRSTCQNMSECIEGGCRGLVLPQLQAGSFFKLIISGSIKMLKMCKYS